MDEKPTLYEGARGAAVRILSRFERSDSYIDKLLEAEYRGGCLSRQDKALLTELVNGVVRWQGKLDWVLTGFYHGEFDKCLTPVKNAMRVALYQIMFLTKIPHPAAINESVEIVKRIKGDKAAGMVNGVLRNVVRRLGDIRYPKKEDDPYWHYSVLHSHPRWLVKRWVERFGEIEAAAFMKANCDRPKLTLRVNALRDNHESIRQWLVEHNVSFQESAAAEDAFEIHNLRDIISSQLFLDGRVSIQDPSATFAAKLANAQPGNTVADLCAAPGGKSFAMAEMMGNVGTIYAFDKYEAKLKLIEQDAKRLGISVISTAAADATKPLNIQQTDIVMVDVPCSGLGTLSRKPDIKWRREAEDIRKLAEMQKEILSNAAAVVKSGGVLVYSACTAEPEENAENIEWFLHNFSQFSLDPAERYLPQSICVDGMMQTLPHKHHCDGAFAARMTKK